MIEASKPRGDSPAATPVGFSPPLAPEIGIEEFSKIDLRVGKFTAAAPVAGADKLLQLTVDLGAETRNVFAGIKAAYPEPDRLVGKLVGNRVTLADELAGLDVPELGMEGYSAEPLPAPSTQLPSSPPTTLPDAAAPAEAERLGFRSSSASAGSVVPAGAFSSQHPTRASFQPFRPKART